MMQEVLAGIGGVLAGVLLFWLGRHSQAEKKRVAPPLTAEQERRNRRALRELANFYTYDGTAQAETDEAARSE